MRCAYVEAFLFDFNGDGYALPVLLSWNFSYGFGLPCDAFEISFIYDPTMLDMLVRANRLRAVFEGETVFFGVVDEFEVSANERGLTATVRGRGLGALLLDNEVEAAEYFSISLDMILDKYVHPLGIREIRKNVSPPTQSMVIRSGASVWRVLEDFLWFGSGVRPRFDKVGTLLLGNEEGKRLVIDRKTALSSMVYRNKRHGVISHVLVKNRVAGTTNLVENTELLNRGGRAGRVINVPRWTMFDAMRSTGEYQIERSKDDEFRVSLSFPSLFHVFPGDAIELSASPLGLYGVYLVTGAQCFANADRAGTNVTLTRQLSYLEH